MADKVQKIRENIEKLKSQLLRGACSSQIAMETRCKEEAYNEVLAILDTIQEEPVRKVWHYANEHPEIEKPILLRKVNGVVELSICHDENFYPEIGEMWAYIEDLLNLSNVESTVKNLKEPVSKNYRERYKRIAQSEKFKKTYEGMSVGEIMHVEGEELVSENLGDYINELSKQFPEVSFAKLSRIAVRVAKWQKQNLWKSADGNDLPEKDREVIVLCEDGRVTFGHRPFEKFITWPIGYGRTEEHEIETYGKGGWNIPNVKYWLDVELPKEMGL